MSSRFDMRRRSALLVATLSILLLSCVDGPAADASTDVPLAPTTEDVYTVGEYAGEDWENFTRVGKVAFDASGNLHILDPEAMRIVVVDQDGNLLREIGGQGEGPGELSHPYGFEILRDGRIVIYDFPRTWQLYDPQGAFLEDITFDVFAGAPGSPLIARPDGRIVTRGGVRMARLDQESEEVEDPHLRDIDLFTLGDSGKEVLYRAWNLEPTEPDEELVAEDEEGRRAMSVEMTRMRAFEPGLHLGMLSDGRLAVVDSMGYRVKLIGVDGTVVGAVERPIAPEPVTEAIMAAERERRREAFEELGELHMAGLALVEGLREQMRASQLAQVDNMVFTEVIPVIAGMAVGAGDLIWVERTGAGGDGPGPIDVLTADGGYVGTLPADGPRIPDAFGPDGLAAYIERGEFEVPVVRGDPGGRYRVSGLARGRTSHGIPVKQCQRAQRVSAPRGWPLAAMGDSSSAESPLDRLALLSIM